MYFGPAGNSESFSAMGYKSSGQVPEYLEKLGLNAFEYQCGRGVNITEESAMKLGESAREKGIRLSIHAPYFISLSSQEEEKRIKSIDYILQSARAASSMGATRIVVHPGSVGKKMSREKAMQLSTDTIKLALSALEEHKLDSVRICLEVMGKIGQLGTLEEVITLCEIDERLIPCVDFGHHNSRTEGSLKTSADFASIFDTIENSLGNERMRSLHAHFSKIEYTIKGGEVRHLTFEDETYGPDFNMLAGVLVKKNIAATIICESAGTQAEDAAAMKRIWEEYRG